jgi:hypothetical protein
LAASHGPHQNGLDALFRNFPNAGDGRNGTDGRHEVKNATLAKTDLDAGSSKPSSGVRNDANQQAPRF